MYFNVQREHKNTCRENEKLKRLLATQKLEFTALQNELEDRDRLIEVIIKILIYKAVKNTYFDPKSKYKHNHLSFTYIDFEK